MANHVTKCLKFVSMAASAGLLYACSGDPFVHPASPFDKVFDEVMARYQLPGLALGVIEDGRVVYTRTAGELVAGSGDKVTTETLFKIASNSKAMTASVLARLVDAGKLRWDDLVIEHLPQFRMYDPWVTRNMQVRDLLVHNSGLPEGGGDLMLWPEPNSFTRADILAGLAYLKPEYSFRSGYAYDNLLYVVAGEVAAAAVEQKTVDWYADALACESASSTRRRGPDTSSRKPAAPDRMQLKTGVWRDPWFGEVSICASSETVRFSAAKSPLLTGTVMRVGERYLVDWDDDSVDVEAWLDFSGNTDASATLLTMSKVDPRGDFSFDYEDLAFTRERDCE